MGAFDVGVVLGRLAPIEHAIVAHHANAAEPRAILPGDGVPSKDSAATCSRQDASRMIAGCQNGVEDVPDRAATQSISMSKGSGRRQA